MLIDSNIVIYSSQERPVELLQFIYNLPQKSVSIVTYVEALGYHRLGEAERQSLEGIFRHCRILPLSQTIAQQAIALRQQRRMGLGMP